MIMLHYGVGAFPWHNALHGGQIWWSPDPRCVLYPNELHIGRSLRKTLKKGSFEIRADTQFDQVVSLCASTRERTWISPDLHRNMEVLHQLGHAHSFECFKEGALVGGLYGVMVGRLFCGESMFSTVSNASKAAFVTMVKFLGKQGCLLDCQLQTPHVKAMGARLIRREQFQQEVFIRSRQPPLKGSWTAELEDFLARQGGIAPANLSNSKDEETNTRPPHAP